MDITKEEKVYLDIYAGELKKSADKEYIAARAMYKLELFDQFFWHSQQALEKYLKAILLFNQQKIKNDGHNLIKLYEKTIDILNLSKNEEIEDFLCLIEKNGLNRYKIYNSYFDKFSVLQFDKLVFYFRKICSGYKYNDTLENMENYLKSKQLIKFTDDNQGIYPYGYIADVYKKESFQREILEWNNFYFGRTVLKEEYNEKDPMVFEKSIIQEDKGAYLFLKDYIKTSKDLKDYHNE